MNQSTASDNQSPLRLLRNEWIFACSLAAGIILRLYQIRRQIPADDEWHALTAALYSGLASIVTHFGAADRCIPLTAFYEFLSDTVGLSEMGMRFLPLACGIASLVLVPIGLGFLVGRREARIAGALLALSPLHVYFSRYARPYSIAMLIAFTGMVAFYRWWTGGRAFWCRAYVVCAILGPYFHLTVAPFLLSPLLFVLFWRGAPVEEQTPIALTRIARMGIAIAAGLGVLLALPLMLDFHSLGGKVGRSGITWNSAGGAWHLLAGSSSEIFVIVAAALSIAGAIVVVRRDRRVGAFLIFGMLCQMLFLVATCPEGILVPIVLARYLVSLLPFLLLFAALALNGVDRLLQRMHYYPAGAVIVVALLLQFFAGPLPSIYYFPNNWTNHAAFQYYYRPEGQNPYEDLWPKNIPAFYSRLKSLPPGSVSVVEAPWYFEWENIHYPYYQRFHRQWMYIGFVDERLFPARAGELPRALPRFWFRNFVHVADLPGLRYRGVNYVILHKDLAHEISEFVPREFTDVSHWVEFYRREFGAPVFEDSQVVVFGVSRLR